MFIIHSCSIIMLCLRNIAWTKKESRKNVMCIYTMMVCRSIFIQKLWLKWNENKFFLCYRWKWHWIYIIQLLSLNHIERIIQRHSFKASNLCNWLIIIISYTKKFDFVYWKENWFSFNNKRRNGRVIVPNRIVLICNYHSCGYAIQIVHFYIILSTFIRYNQQIHNAKKKYWWNN